MLRSFMFLVLYQNQIDKGIHVIIEGFANLVGGSWLFIVIK